MSEPHFFCGCYAQISEAVERRWTKGSFNDPIYWGVAGVLPGLTLQQIRSAFADAIASWSSVCDLTFVEAMSLQSADILASTGIIDGPGQVLAWSEFPAGTRRVMQKYDTGDRYIVAEAPPPGKIDLLAVICHELGHALGLDHDSMGSGALMEPTYQPGRRVPQPPDIERIKKLYPRSPIPADRAATRMRIYDQSDLLMAEYKINRIA